MARTQKVPTVIFANDDELLEISAGTKLEEEEMEYLVTDGCHLFGFRSDNVGICCRRKRCKSERVS